MSDDTYNGWVNRETWAAALHLSNDYDFYRETRERLQHKTRTEQADELEGWVTDLFNIVLFPDGDVVLNEAQSHFVRCMISDVGSLWRVNWFDVADSFEVEQTVPEFVVASDAHLDDMGD